MCFRPQPRSRGNTDWWWIGDDERAIDDEPEEEPEDEEEEDKEGEGGGGGKRRGREGSDLEGMTEDSMTSLKRNLRERKRVVRANEEGLI